MLTSAEDIILCELKCGSDISSNTSCAWQRKKTSTHFPPIQGKKTEERLVVGVIYRQGRGIGPGSWHEPGPTLRATPRVRLWSFGPGSCQEPGPMSPTEPGPMIHGPLAARTGTIARHWSRSFSEPGPMAGAALDQRWFFY